MPVAPNCLLDKGFLSCYHRAVCIFIDAAKGKYPVFLENAIRLIKNGGLILADNILYKGYVMSDYNKHKQRTAVRNLREFLKELDENEELEVKVLEVGDGLAIARKK